MFRTTRGGRRDTPYQFEELFVTFHRSKAGAAWRWRTELTLITATVVTYLRLAHLTTAIWAAVLLAAPITAALAVPRSRRFLTARAWCVITRHRLQRACFESRLHTRAGRLPLIVWIRPTKVGARAYLVCRAGTCADDFDNAKERIAAACFAREARIIPNRRWSQLVTLDIVRHDPLMAKTVIKSPVLAAVPTGPAAWPGHDPGYPSPPGPEPGEDDAA